MNAMANVIEIKNLQRILGKQTVLKKINAQVQQGDVIALLGKNGAGKTTLIETLLGFAYPTEGSTTLWNLRATDIGEVIKEKIGFVPQVDELLPSITGKEHLRLYREFRHHWNQVLVDRLVQEWEIPLDQKISKMSVGQRQKLSILLAVAHDPELLILDEPVASLDPIARRQFLQQLVDMAADETRAIIFSTHIVSDVERVANKVWMLRNGDLIYQDDLDSLKENVARITITAKKDLAKNLIIADAHNLKIHGQQAVTTLMNWTDERKSALEKDLDAKITIERLSLEDIFLELNQ